MVQELWPTPLGSATIGPYLSSLPPHVYPPPRRGVGLPGQEGFFWGGARGFQARLPPERVLYENPCTAGGAGVGMNWTELIFMVIKGSRSVAVRRHRFNVLETLVDIWAIFPPKGNQIRPKGARLKTLSKWRE